LVIGLGAALVGARILASRLFGIGPQDPISFAVAGGCLIVVAALATLLPVWRAMRIEPMVALRQD
jgi:putative ABC transport system permease protein